MSNAINDKFHIKEELIASSERSRGAKALVIIAALIFSVATLLLLSLSILSLSGTIISVSLGFGAPAVFPLAAGTLFFTGCALGAGAISGYHIRRI